MEINNSVLIKYIDMYVCRCLISIKRFLHSHGRGLMDILFLVSHKFFSLEVILLEVLSNIKYGHLSQRKFETEFTILCETTSHFC